MISDIFSDFFNCFTIPTIILNSKFKIVFTHNLENNAKDSIYTSKAIEYLKANDSHPGIIYIDIKNQINFTCISFSHYDNSLMYILIGPYLLQEDIVNHKNFNSNYITKDSLDRMVKLYSLIIDNHLCIHNLNNTKSPCINHAIEYIEKNYCNEISIDEICNELNINKCYFCNIFKKETGTTFINYLNTYKVEKSKELLKDYSLSLLDISLSAGFNNQSYYSTVFKKITGKTPLEFRDSI